MSDLLLRKALIRLAFVQPETRPHLLPLLRAASNPFAGGVHEVYPDKNSRSKQPPGLLNLEPLVAQILGVRSLGKVRIPSSSGIRNTSVADLAGVPVSTLDRKNLHQIEKAHQEEVELPPIIIEVIGKSSKIQLLDGHHRLAVARKNRHKTISVQWILR
jgi:hypothetical protein